MVWKCGGCNSIWNIDSGFTDHDDECPICTSGIKHLDYNVLVKNGADDQ